MQAVALVVDVLAHRAARHAIVMRQVYNKTTHLPRDERAAASARTLTFVDDGDLAALAAAIRPATRFVFAETFTNPLMRAQDVPALAAVRRIAGARLVIDSTIATPWGVSRAARSTPGVDVVIGSLTKALGGQDAALGGYIATNDTDVGNHDHGSDRDARRHPRRRARAPRRRGPARRRARPRAPLRDRRAGRRVPRRVIRGSSACSIRRCPITRMRR